MNEVKTLQLLGLAQRAGKVVSGEEIVLNAVRSGKCKLVLLATDSSPNTKKKFRDKCLTYDVMLFELGDRNTIGKAIGKDTRVVIGINDQGFANKIQEFVQHQK